MKVRYLVSVGGAEPRQAEEKIKGKFVYYDVSDYEAVRLIDAEYAVPENEAEYTKAKANQKALDEAKARQHEITETLKNLDVIKGIFESKKKQYSDLGAEIKEMDAKIKQAEASFPKED